MYGTIEPRLIALLNDEPLDVAPSAPSFNLPPIQDNSGLRRTDRPSPHAITAVGSSGIPISNKSDSTASSASSRTIRQNISSGNDEREVSSAAAASSRGRSSPQSLRKILGVDTDVSNSTKRRKAAVNSKDEFVQLPQPQKKQRTVKQVFPPIIIGLFEPPPNAALFPPIASSSLHDLHSPETLTVGSEAQRVDNESDEKERRDAPQCKEAKEAKTAQNPAVKGRKKWGESETNELMLGVSKHGVGNWTKILRDPDFAFNRRKAVDLKDRFRTCCPHEFNGSSAKATDCSIAKTDSRPSNKSEEKSGLMSENILVEDSETTSAVTETGQRLSTYDSARKSRAHRKNLDDLAQLGIEEPFKTSSRRKRRAFTSTEDENIMLGYEKHGPAWTLIQRDPQYGLQSRRPIDIRDRMRNKRHEQLRSSDDAKIKPKDAAAEIENGEPQPEVGRSSASLVYPEQQVFQVVAQGNVNTSDTQLESKILAQPTNPSFTFRDPTLDITYLTAPDVGESLSFAQTFDWSESVSSIGEMDISRLLLDDNWPAPIPAMTNNSRPKQSFTDISSICTSTADSVPNAFSFSQ